MKTIKGRVSHFDDDYKIIIIGDTNVGKSCLLYSFLHNNCRFCFFICNLVYKNTTQTIGAEFGSKIVRTSDDKIIKLNIWDTAGQEKFRSIAANYYKGALGAIIVFDVTK
jgi:small GTP-binding protein